MNPGISRDLAASSVEAALVLCCATTAPTDERTAKASELAARVRDWDRVIETAHRHAVLPIVYRYLSLQCPAAVPEDALAKLRTRFQLIMLYNRHLAAELIRLMRLLEGAGLEVLTFKGPVLAKMSYGAIEFRQFVDLDLMVRQNDLPRVAEILSAERYRSPHRRREGLATGYFQEFEDSFLGPDGLGAVDVHWKLTPRSFRFAPDEQRIWQLARPVDLEGGTVRAIAPEDLLLYLCVHAAKHGWVTLGTICDVAETLRAREAIDLHAILDDAAPLGSRRMLLTGLYLAHHLVGAPIPADILEIAERDRATRVLASRVVRGLFRESNRSHSEFDPWMIPLESIEGGRARVRYLIRRMLAPTMGDFELIPLPAALFPLYWMIRPLRMIVQYGPRLVRGIARRDRRRTGGAGPRRGP